MKTRVSVSGDRERRRLGNLGEEMDRRRRVVINGGESSWRLSPSQGMLVLESSCRTGVLLIAHRRRRSCTPCWVASVAATKLSWIVHWIVGPSPRAPTGGSMGSTTSRLNKPATLSQLASMEPIAMREFPALHMVNHTVFPRIMIPARTVKAMARATKTTTAARTSAQQAYSRIQEMGHGAERQNRCIRWNGGARATNLPRATNPPRAATMAPNMALRMVGSAGRWRVDEVGVKTRKDEWNNGGQSLLLGVCCEVMEVGPQQGGSSNARLERVLSSLAVEEGDGMEGSGR
ncbi:uncharacterized protein B0H64DRAFT_410021 [Chaetomium fimeti]|uniref:Uncharacterized protein n=1 Tax=Chaetomium fimeti TaxID=1854472 RepID=A0AAE0LN26_9PEZI|nr:hypothetical protein B0H64DRAFT_410021 [Chaetomium fimeti]